jgi:hypothetical protein
MRLTKRPFVIGCLAIAALPFLVIASYSYLYYPWRSHAQIHCVVLDTNTNQPVARARVVVDIVAFKVFDEAHMGYGLVTDQQGNFSLDVYPRERFSWIWVTASAPDDKFDQVFTRGHEVTLHTVPLPPNRRQPYMYYKNFRASIEFESERPWRPMIFPGERW